MIKIYEKEGNEVILVLNVLIRAGGGGRGKERERNTSNTA